MVDKRWAMRIVIASWLVGDFANGAADFFLGEGVERRSGFVEHQQLRMPQQGAGNGKPLFFSAGNLHAAFADQRVQALVGALQQAMRGGLVEHIHTFFVGRGGIHKQQVLADGSREELGVLGDEPDLLAQGVEIYASARECRCKESRPTSAGRGRPAASPESILPAPEGPTNAIVSPRAALKLIPSSAGVEAV